VSKNIRIPDNSVTLLPEWTQYIEQKKTAKIEEMPVHLVKKMEEKKIHDSRDAQVDILCL
jgi:hypothetical protein